MTVDLLIIGAVMTGYLAFAIIGGVFISNIDDDDKKKSLLNGFITLNVLLLCGAMAYAYVSIL
jgi:Na+/proline symporter